MEKIVNKRDLEYLIEKDEKLRKIYLEIGEPPNWEREPNFISLSRIILEQQISLASAKAHFERLSAYLGAFTPERILSLSDLEMRECHISSQKSKYLRILAEKVVEKRFDFEELNQLNEQDAKEKLVSIKGIGNWTAEIYLQFCLQKKDILPLGDIAVRAAIKEVYGVKSEEEIVLVTENWKPFRSLGTYLMWHYYLNKRGRIAEF